MNLTKLANDYITAWNRRDAGRLVSLMHEGFAYYNAFWMESSAGRDAAVYLRDRLEEDKYWYQQIGPVIQVENGVAFHYSAHKLTDAAADRTEFIGAEVFNIRDDKIIAVSDFYCDPDRAALKEVARLTAKRHGLPKYAKSGLHVARDGGVSSEPD